MVGGVATAAFLTWALQSASAKSMKPGEVQKRSREEENAVFQNRDGEVTICLAHTPDMLVPWCLDSRVKHTCVLQVQHGDAEWKSILTSGQYRVLRKSGTELPWSSPLEHVSHPVLAVQTVHGTILQVIVSSSSHITVVSRCSICKSGGECSMHKHAAVLGLFLVHLSAFTFMCCWVASVKKQVSVSTGETQWHIQVRRMWQPSLRVPVKV